MAENNGNGNNVYAKLATYALMGAVFLGVTLPVITKSYKPKDVQPKNQAKADFWENMDLRETSDNRLKLIIEGEK